MLLQMETNRVAPDVTVVNLRGRVTLGRETEHLEKLVTELAAKNEKKVVFDLSGVDYIDSAGIGTLTFCFGAMKDAGGSLCIAGPTDRVKRLFQVTHVERFLAVFANVGDACASFT